MIQIVLILASPVVLPDVEGRVHKYDIHGPILEGRQKVHAIGVIDSAANDSLPPRPHQLIAPASFAAFPRSFSFIPAARKFTLPGVTTRPIPVPSLFPCTERIV